tara:strand:- start:1406 stop:1636 length:231 start_codon:yes stop_codon:yes gene_type:complete
MNYEELIETISEVINNKKIYKEGLTLLYELDEENHAKMDEHLFYKSKPEGNFEHRDIIELEIDGVIIKFIKKSLEY